MPGTARAFALVTPPCGGCGELPPDFTPLDASHSKNVSLGSALPEAPEGAWCFVLEGGIDPSTATLVASVVTSAGPHGPGFSLESAEWFAEAPDCAPGQVEVRTFGYGVEEGDLIATPDREVAFSFVVP